MRSFILVISSLFCSWLTAQEQTKTAIVMISIIDVEKGTVLKDQTVLIDKGIITNIFPASQKMQLTGFRVINAKGKYLIPGLIDTHVHLHYFFKINQPQLLQAPLNVFLYYGVTGLREASGSIFTKEMLALRDSIESAKKNRTENLCVRNCNVHHS